MKREDVKTIIENAELSVDEKLKSIMDMNGNDLNEIKSKNKELQSKVDEYSSYKSQLDEVNKKLETYSTFEEKANKYDEIFPKYEQYNMAAIIDIKAGYGGEEKLRKINASAKKFKIKDEFIEFATSKIGEVDDYDSAFEEFSKKNPQYLESKEKIIETNPEMNGKNKSSDVDLSKLY